MFEYIFNMAKRLYTVLVCVVSGVANNPPRDTLPHYIKSRMDEDYARDNCEKMGGDCIR